MKKLLYFVLIVCLPVITFFEWQNYRRHNPPSAYGYQTSEDIDLDYFDKEVVKSYFQDAVEMEGFGRYSWKEFGVDVLTDRPQSPEKRGLVNTYEQMKASVIQSEQMLRRSQKLKDKGFNNVAIQQMMENGWTEDQYQLFQLLGGKSYLEQEDIGENVFSIQKRLSELGFELKVDGYFREETASAVKDFQSKNGLYPSGKVDDLTAKKIMFAQ